ncbi:MAG: MFS transporter [Angustibacter sp.]
MEPDQAAGPPLQRPASPSSPPDPHAASGSRAANPGRPAGRMPRARPRTIGRGARRLAGSTRRAAGATGRRVRRATHAQGAGESGLAKVIELHGISAAGDALVLISLANTVFFSVPVGEARSRIALYLLVTMLPFCVMAPIVGPVLDRFRHGRRYALAITLVTRAFLAWVMAGAVVGGQEAFSLYPAAFGHLVASKAYNVTRAAAIPRVLPSGLSLVTANSRVLLGGIAAIAVATPFGALLQRIGPEWSLRLAFAVFVVGTGLALALPRRVDSAAGERTARLSSALEPATQPAQHPTDPQATGRPAAARVGRRSRWSIGPRVVLGLRAVAALRAFTGFLTLFLAFALRTEPISDRLPLLGVIGLVAGFAGVGSTIGTSLGAVLRRAQADVVVTITVGLATVGAAVGGLLYGLVPVLVTGLCAGLSAALGKLALDALVQREVPEEVRASAFARSETVLQLAWVAGGGLGIVMPLGGAWGLRVAAIGLALVVIVTVHSLLATRGGVARQRG